MSAELIDSFISRPDIDKDKEYLIAALLEIKKAYDGVKNLGLSISGANSMQSFAAATQQASSTINTASAASQKLTTANIALAKSTEQAKLEQSKMSKELKATVEIENTEVGTIARARAELKGLNLLRNNVNVTTKEGREELIRLNAEIDKNNKFIRENADAYLKQKINIGNYPDLLKGLGSGFANLANGLLATVGITAGLSGIVSFLSSSVDEANQAEQATTRFKNALANIGREDVFGRLTQKAEDLAKQFRYLDNDNITEVFQQLITYGKLTEKQITDLTPVIINFAAKSGLSVNEAASTIIKALEGNARALKDYGISIKDGGDVTERLGIIMTDLKGKVDGAAEAFGNTFAGKAAIAKQEVANLKEEIGNKLTPILGKFYQSVSYIISGITAIASGISKNIIAPISDGLSIFSAFLSKSDAVKGINEAAFGFGNFAAAKKRIEDLRNERAEVERSIQTQKELGEARKTADSVAADAASKPLKVQQELLRDNIALKEASFKTYNDLVSKGKALTDEGKAAARQLYTDSLTVIALQKSIAQTQDKTILGTGDPDAGKKTKTVAHIKDISDAVAELRKELKTISSEQAIGEITPKDADIDRVKAYDKAFKDIFDRGGNENTPIVKQLAVEVSPISQRVIEAQLHDIINKVKKEPIELAPPTVGKVTEIDPRPGHEEEIKLTEEMLQRELTLQQTASLKEQAILQDKYNNGKITKEQFEKDMLEIQSRYSKEAVAAQIKAVSDEIAMMEPGTIERENAEKRLADLQLKYNQIVADDREKKTAAIVKQVQDIQDVFDKLSSLGAGLVAINTTRQKNDLQDLEDARQKSYDQELARINASTLSEADKADKIKVLEAQRQAQKDEFDRKNRAIQQKQAAYDKAISIANIIFETTKAVIHQLGSGDPYTAFARAIAVGAIGAAQLAIAIAQPLPKFAQGTDNHKGGPFIWGEEGTELAIEPSGKTYLSPNEATLGYAPAGTKIISNKDLVKYTQTFSTKATDKVLSNASYGQNELAGLFKENTRELKNVHKAIKSIPQSRININAKHDPNFQIWVDKNVRGRR